MENTKPSERNVICCWPFISEYEGRICEWDCMEARRGKKRKNRIWRIPNTGSSGRLSPLNNQDCSRRGTHIKFLLVLSPWIMMQHNPMLTSSSVKGTGLTALYGWSHFLATILQDRGGNWGSERLSNQLKVTHLTRSRTGAWNIALLTPEIKLLAKSKGQFLVENLPWARHYLKCFTHIISLDHQKILWGMYYYYCHQKSEKTED